MTKLALPVLTLTLFLAGCEIPSPPNGQATGGGGVSAFEGHSARKPGASGSGSSAANSGQGPVAGSGATDEPNNAQSPSESNGGLGSMPAPATEAK